MRQLAVVGEQHQTLAVTIQPSGRVNAWHRHIIRQGRASIGIGEAAQNIVWLVEQQIAAGRFWLLQYCLVRWLAGHIGSLRLVSGSILPRRQQIGQTRRLLLKWQARWY